jgi:hypothetical protein
MKELEEQNAILRKQMQDIHELQTQNNLMLHAQKNNAVVQDLIAKNGKSNYSGNGGRAALLVSTRTLVQPTAAPITTTGEVRGASQAAISLPSTLVQPTTGTAMINISDFLAESSDDESDDDEFSHALKSSIVWETLSSDDESTVPNPPVAKKPKVATKVVGPDELQKVVNTLKPVPVHKMPEVADKVVGTEKGTTLGQPKANGVAVPSVTVTAAAGVSSVSASKAIVSSTAVVSKVTTTGAKEVNESAKKKQSTSGSSEKAKKNVTSSARVAVCDKDHRFLKVEDNTSWYKETQWIKCNKCDEQLGYKKYFYCDGKCCSYKLCCECGAKVISEAPSKRSRRNETL